MESKVPLARCNECPLAPARCVPSKTPTGAKIALVSRSPGKYDHNGPFSGPSGKVLDYLLAKYGVQRNEIITTNVVLCETDNPPPKAIVACADRLRAEVDSVETIIAAGTEAVRSFTKYGTTHAARGFVHYRENSVGDKQRVIATNNPALVLRDNDVLPELLTDFKIALDPLTEPEFPSVSIIHNAVEARDYLRTWENLPQGTIIGADLEWAGNTIQCIGVSFNGTKSFVISRSAFESDEQTRNAIKSFFENDFKFIWHNGKSDTTILRANSIEGRVDLDTFILSRVLDEEPGRHELGYLLQVNFGWPDYEPESVKHFKKTGLFDYYGDEPELIEQAKTELYTYNGYDAAGTVQLFNKLSVEAKQQDLYEKPYLAYFLPAANAFRNVEMRGFYFDPEEACNINEREVYPRIKQLTENLQAIAGHPLLNPRSPKQLSAVYYNDFGLKHKLRDSGNKSFKTSTGAEVRKEIIEGRATARPGQASNLKLFAELHQRYSKIDKQRGTYIEGLTIRTLESGKLHSQFNIGGTVTYRNGSKDPNFQNITREGVDGIAGIRTLFLASPGCRIIQADFSQAELRTCAVLSGDINLLDIYRDSERSLHKERAAAFYGDNYTKEEYVKSKNINFGVTYGQSAFAFAQMYNMPEAEAQDYIDSWWRAFPQLYKWTENVWETAKKQGFAKSPFGFKRRINLIPQDVNALKRELVNFMPQNVAAWLTNCALTELVMDYGVPVISTVHDSILADVPESEAMETALTIKKVMEEQASKLLGWELPFNVDISIGETWGSVQEVSLDAA